MKLDFRQRLLGTTLLVGASMLATPAFAQDAPAADDWAWGMYTHYYDELASARQRGFEKLFWEVFEQAYDRALRVEAE